MYSGRDCTTQQQIICILIILLAYSVKELSPVGSSRRKSLRPAEAVVSTHEQNNADIIGINYSRNKILARVCILHSMEVRRATSRILNSYP